MKINSNMLRMSIPVVFLTAGAACYSVPGSVAGPGPQPETTEVANADYQRFSEFFDEVFKTMEENYYYPVSRKHYERFLFRFEKKIYPRLLRAQKTEPYIKWRGAAFMVEDLRDKEDVFSAFFPPKAADDFEKEVLGKRVDLGLEGVAIPQGYLLSRVEPRSDAYAKGLRPRDLLLGVDGRSVVGMPESEVQDLLTPLEGSAVQVLYVANGAEQRNVVELVSREYFKQTVFLVPVDVPGVYCLQIKRFNRATSEDMTVYMTYLFRQGARKLILDLRDNPGGPPLAAREISAFFLPPAQEFAYFKMKNRPRAVLDVPLIPSRYHYQGDLLVLVNHKSGSAAELFSGIMQSKGRAEVMGSNSAGQVFLKSMFNFDDKSMVLLVTARGFHPDGTVFSFKGIEPDARVDPERGDLLHYAAEYMARAKREGVPAPDAAP